MPQLSLNEIRSRAMAFSKEWANESSEDAEAKTFWDGFFEVFGISRRRFASFEKPVKKQDGKGGFIDLLWKGVLLVEHKSRGKDLDSAYGQARDYFAGLKDRDLPRYVVVSDFERFRLYDLEEDKQYEFTLNALHHYVHLFGFMTGRQVRVFGKQDSVSVMAVEQLGNLHDKMGVAGYQGHQLEVFLIRLLFCLFAEDNGIFEKNEFREFLESRTAEDGSDLDGWLSKLFYTLNTAGGKRLKNLPGDLNNFPYVNGRLFEEQLPPAQFDAEMREALLECAGLEWSKISPEIFGSLFQSVMDKKKRREGGKHYTAETNIRKALEPLFLDDLHAEFELAKRSKQKLLAFQQKLSKIKLLDPACGCGNFLVVAYRELRKIELDVLRVLYKNAADKMGGMLDVSLIVLVDVDQLYGIEIDDWPAHIAQVALWLTDHQMNVLVSEEFGQNFARIPLLKSPNIVCGNALTTDWGSVVPSSDCSFVVGNPPFIGSKNMNDDQTRDAMAVFQGVRNGGVLDFVAAWYVCATRYMLSAPVAHRPRCALVSTNSITQGEQVPALWSWMNAQGIKISFAHRTFQWTNEARGPAAVHCVIIGFGIGEPAGRKSIFEYDTPKAEPHIVAVKEISPYLIDYDPMVLVNPRMRPLCQVSEVVNGSIPADGGNLILDDEAQRLDLVTRCPEVAPHVRLYLGAEGFIHDIKRWCLWLKDCSPAVLRSMSPVMERVRAVQIMREKSTKDATKAKAATPTLFTEDRQPTSGNYLAIPRTSSEARRYLPIGFLSHTTIAANDLQIVPGATVYEFGVLASLMHIEWARVTSGGLESRIRYSAKLTYNTLPWPTPNDKQCKAIESAAQAVLDQRANSTGSSLADLYDPLAMPGELVKAHQALDRAVDAAYRSSKFSNERERVAFLLDRYQKISAPMLAAAKKSIRRRASSS